MIVRRLRQTDDFQKIQGLLKHTLAESTHFIRDESFIKYSMCFPNVSKDGMFIAQADNQIVGFAMVSIVEEKWGRVGVVVELQCTDPSSFSNLIQAITKYCVDKNLDAMAVHPPPLPTISTVLRGWLKRAEYGVMMVKPISFLPLLRLLLLQNKPCKIIGDKKIRLCIDDETIKVTAKEIKVIDDDLERDCIRISLSSKTLINIMFNQLSPLFSWLSGGIKIKSITNAPLALKLLYELKLSGFTYVSPVDMI